MISLIAFLLWIVYAIYEGKREAFYFSMKMKAVISSSTMLSIGDEHKMFTIQRALAAGLVLLSIVNTGWLYSGIVILSCALVFPFFHDGQYYESRKKLDNIYPDGWFDQSQNSTAKSDKLHLFTPINRIVLASVGASLMIYEIIRNW